MFTIDKTTEVAKLTPTKRLAWFTTAIIVVLGTMHYIDRNMIVQVKDAEIQRTRADRDEWKEAFFDVQRELKECNEKYNDHIAADYHERDSIASDNRKFLNEIKNIGR